MNLSPRRYQETLRNLVLMTTMLGALFLGLLLAVVFNGGLIYLAHRIYQAGILPDDDGVASTEPDGESPQ
jgi:hypothetical protein